MRVGKWLAGKNATNGIKFDLWVGRLDKGYNPKVLYTPSGAVGRLVHQQTFGIRHLLAVSGKQVEVSKDKTASRRRYTASCLKG